MGLVPFYALLTPDQFIGLLLRDVVQQANSILERGREEKFVVEEEHFKGWHSSKHVWQGSRMEITPKRGYTLLHGLKFLDDLAGFRAFVTKPRDGRTSYNFGNRVSLSPSVQESVLIYQLMRLGDLKLDEKDSVGSLVQAWHFATFGVSFPECS